MRLNKGDTPIRKIRKDTRLQRNKEQASILTAQIEALSSDVQALEVKNSNLQLRGEVVLASVIAAHFAVKLMKQSIFREGSDERASLRAVTALGQVEARLRVLVTQQSPQLLLEPLAPWIPSIVSAESSETLLKRYLNRSLVKGKSHLSLLDGRLCSFLHTTLLLMLYDSTIQERTVQLVAAGPDAWQQWIADTRHDIEQLMASAVEPDGSKSSSVLAAIAALILHFNSMWCVTPLLHPLFLARSLSYHAEMGYAKPFAIAQLDMVIDELALSEKQLGKAYEIGQIYQALAAPLHSQQTAIKARMAELLAAGLGSQSPGGPQTGEPAAVPGATRAWPAAAAAAGSKSPTAVAAGTPSPWWDDVPVPVEVEQAAAVAAAGSSDQHTTESASAWGLPSGSSLQVHLQAAATAAAAPANAAIPAATAAARVNPSSSIPKAEGPLHPSNEPLLEASAYHELLALADQLPGLEGQLHWLDVSCGLVMAGLLSWWQMALWFVASKPYQPQVIFCARMMFKRACEHAKDDALWDEAAAAAPPVAAGRGEAMSSAAVGAMWWQPQEDPKQ